MPARLWVPCGAETRPPGTQVLRGEPLAVQGCESPAPASGRIGRVSRQFLIGGREVRAVELETDAGASEPSPLPVTQPERVRSMLGRLPKSELEPAIGQLIEGGVSANRWTCPDLIAQLRQAIRMPVTAIVCGALDLDPALPLQQALTAEHSLDLAAGVAALARLAGARQAVIALPEDSSKPIVTAMRAAASQTATTLHPLLNEYPIANPSLLVRRVLGRKLASGALPTEAGAILLDGAAAVAIGRYFLHGEPMLRVPLGIYDPRHARVHLLMAPVGARLQEVLDGAGITGQGCQLRAGHVLRDIPLAPDAIVGGGELKAFISAPSPQTGSSACLRCGWCIEACPVRIHPAGLLEAAQQQDPELANHYGLRACIECGICSYVCPSRLPLLQSIRSLRGT